MDTLAEACGAITVTGGGKVFTSLQWQAFTDRLASLPPEQAAQVQEPLSADEIWNASRFQANRNSFVAGVRFAEKHYGIGVQLTKDDRNV